MPFTPFIGLSVIVHLFVILVHRIFGRSVTVGRAIVWKTTKMLRFSLALIIVSIFALVLTTASVLVRASIVDKNSSINLLERYVVAPSETFFQANNNLSGGNSQLLLVDKVFASNRVGSVCVSAQEPTSNYDDSIVNYLMSKDQDYSFEARQNIAAAYGIADYAGSSPQNVLLLRQMIASESCKS